LFSVVIPLYNKRDYIQRAVGSVLSQTWQNFEVIVVDDGSTDGSAEVIECLGRRVRVVWQANAGEGAARNAGIFEAHHDWVAFLDADDAWYPDHLEELDRIRRNFPDCDVIATDHLHSQSSDSLPRRPLRGKSIKKIDYFDAAADNVGIVCASSIAVRKHIFQKAGGFSAARMGADLECWARLALECDFAVSTRVTAVHFRGTGGAMESSPDTSGPERTSATLKEVSPTVATLMERYPLLDEATKVSVDSYINARISSSVKAALFAGRVTDARCFVQLYRRRRRLSEQLLSSVVRLPVPILRLSLAMRARLKHMKVYGLNGTSRK